MKVTILHSRKCKSYQGLCVFNENVKINITVYVIYKGNLLCRKMGSWKYECKLKLVYTKSRNKL